MRALRNASIPLAGAALVGLLWACAIGPTPTGELGNGQFSYACPTGSVDVGCTGGAAEASTGYVDPITGLTTNIPRVLAVGARFAVDYTSLVNGGSGTVQGNSSYSVSPASSRLAELSNGTLLGKRPGYLALLAYSPGTQSVEDFIFVRLAAIASLTPDRAEVFLSNGSGDTLSVTAADDASEPLAGRLACVWTVTAGSDKVLIQGANDGASVRIEAVADGDATLSVVCSGNAANVKVHVSGGVSVGDAGGDAGEGGGLDSGGDVLSDGGTHG